MQKKRKLEVFNGKLDEAEIEQFCILDIDSKNLLDQASVRFSLSYRAQYKLKNVARSIADLANEEHITKAHLLEALSYRRI